MKDRLALAALVLTACQPAAPAGDPTGGDSSGAATTTGGAPTTGASTGEGSDARYTYYRDAKAILDARCATCHRAGDVAPFALETAEEAAMFASILPAAIEDGTMPPWPPSAECNVYEHDRSLLPEEREVLLGWVAEGAVIGDPHDAPPPADGGPPIAWDLELPLPEAYVPTQFPDDYRCFVIDWPEDQPKYVVGLDVVPDQRPIVHHMIAYLIPPASVASYKKRDSDEPGLGYTCFGSPGGGYDQQWLGAWAPGALPTLDLKRGIPVQPGSAVVMQMHYHPTPDPPADRTRLLLKLADSVDVPLHVIPYTNPEWLGSSVMRIPAGESQVVHSFEVDLTNWIGDFFPDAGVENGEPFVLHKVGLHMHTRGTRASLSLERKGGGSDCALYIPRWDFDWQGGYVLQQPLTVNPGDRLKLTCEWDNSAANQPIVDGVQQEPVDIFWGEGTGDEMCLAIMTVSPPG